MRSATLALSVLLLSSSVVSAAPAKPARITAGNLRAAKPKRAAKPTRSARPKRARASKQVSAEVRGQLAVAAVQQALSEWVHPDAAVQVRAAIVPFNGDVRNPITGQGPVEVFVTHTPPKLTNPWARVRNYFSPWSKQKYLVYVGRDGTTEIMERLSLAPQYRFARFLRDKIPLHALVADFYRSNRASEGLFTALGASGALALSPALSGALFMRLLQVVHEGIASQSQVRDRALEDTVAWAKRRRRGGAPTLMEAYRAYVDRIDHIDPGVRPADLSRFTTALSIRQL
jgi:hypothetical protein